MPNPNAIPYTQFACIGAGFSGIGLGATLGGPPPPPASAVPGCACDVPSVLYIFSFAANPSWTRILPSAPEIRAYLGAVAYFSRHGHRNAISYSLRVIRPVLEGKASVVDLERSVEEAYVENIQKTLNKTNWSSGGCNSWYVKEDSARNHHMTTSTPRTYGSVSSNRAAGSHESQGGVCAALRGLLISIEGESRHPFDYVHYVRQQRFQNPSRGDEAKNSELTALKEEAMKQKLKARNRRREERELRRQREELDAEENQRLWQEPCSAAWDNSGASAVGVEVEFRIPPTEEGEPEGEPEEEPNKISGQKPEKEAHSSSQPRPRLEPTTMLGAEASLRPETNTTPDPINDPEPPRLEEPRPIALMDTLYRVVQFGEDGDEIVHHPSIPAAAAPSQEW
ncbi:hypothetical protein B0T25DRAFT_569316 [Lasiosphaeria hispida]|uniref:Uncharacterized protein n=1 Tax=Lasiosphaeria hispida TaxID=260671 RepID=A0AAJ0MBI5_9PEZI|nr:hypothetical protein B0T25DRAFT_569316 [Lasiosphaeria hispida]